MREQMRKEDRLSKYGGLFLISIVCFSVVALLITAFFSRRGSVGKLGFPSIGKKLAVVRVNGLIYQSDEIVEHLNKCRENDSIKGVILRVNSPGGGVVASQEIYTAVKRVREDGKPVVVSMGASGTSGGYYIASAADAIVCSPGTVTGSIGVIASFVEAEELLTKMGLNFNTVKSGKYKDTGSYERKMSEAEKRLLQGAIDDIFQQFIDDIVAGRGERFRAYLAEKKGATTEQISEDGIKGYVKSYADGRILTGNQAYRLGFVDELGDFRTAVRLAAEKAGIEGEPDLVEVAGRKSVFQEYLGNAAHQAVLGVVWRLSLPVLMPQSARLTNGGE